MKNVFKIGLISLLVLAVISTIVYKAVNKAPSAELAQNEQVLEILKAGGCIDCHTADPKLPFYASFPIIGDMVKKDSQDGYRAFDISGLMAALENCEAVDPIDLAKVEKVVLDDRMPMFKYYIMHWGSSLNAEERDIVLDWAKNVRAGYYNDDVAEAYANEPIRPIAEELPYDADKAALGYMLFHDTRLSVDNTVSCASCHGLSTAGVDNKQYSEGVNGQLGGVNAPTVYNAAYNFVQFWDGRAKTLADQAAGPPLNPVEMASESFAQIIAKLEQDKEFAAEFAAVYPDGLTEANITDAIQQFEYTLLTPNSRFDKWLRGDAEALTAEEIEGYELFKKYDCATCHNGPIAGGLSYELMGLRNEYFADRGLEMTNEDNGRYKETQLERDRHRFKVPGLRNVEHTWPYYHDGTRLTLEDAVRDMGYYQSDVKMTDAEVAKVTAFLKTLTGEHQGIGITTTNSVDDIYGHDDEH